MRALWIVVAILAVALALRVGLVERDSYKPINDAKSYLQLASQIDHTGDYSGNDVGAGNTRGPTAYFPPAYPYLLAPFSGSVHAARVAQAVLGTIVVGLVVPVLLWLSVAFVNAETPRFREPIDPFLILLAGCALQALGRCAVPALGGAPVGRRLEPAAPAGGAQLVEMVERPA